MRRVLPAIVFLAAVATTRAATQGFPQPSGFAVEDPVLRRIWAIETDSSQLPHLAQVLFDSLGPRLTASPGMTPLVTSTWSRRCRPSPGSRPR